MAAPTPVQLLMTIFFCIHLVSSVRANSDEIDDTQSPSICGTVVFDSGDVKEGTLSSPNYPLPYPGGIRCEYTFVAMEGECAQVKFVDVDFQDGEDILSDLWDNIHFTEIRGSTTYEIREVLWAGSGMYDKPQVMSAGKQMSAAFVSYLTPPNNSSRGFLAQYKFVTDFGLNPRQQDEAGVCRFSYNGEVKSSGSFTSPNHPGVYPMSTDCYYRLHGKDVHRIYIYFTFFKVLSFSESCGEDGDYVDITSASGVLLDRFCGYRRRTPRLNQLLTYEHSSIQVKFHSSRYRNKYITAAFKGFKALYGFNVQPCVDLIDNWKMFQGIFSSPGYPNPYNGTRCVTNFETEQDKRIQITFETLDLMYPDGDPQDPTTCEGVDNLMFMQTIDGNNRTLYGSCGAKAPPQLMSAGPNLTAVFTRVQPAASAKGFRAQYNFVSDFGIKEGTQEEKGVCRFVLRSDEKQSGLFHSPNYPGMYPRDTDCFYTFIGLNFQAVHINFTHFDVEGFIPECSEETQSDYIEISYYNTTDPSPEAKPRLCGLKHGRWQVQDILSKSNYLQLKFHSNDVFDATGFEGAYQFMQESCDMHFHASTGKKKGTFHSPRFPETYPGLAEGTTCRYSFHATGKESVRITFTRFHLKYNLRDPINCEESDNIEFMEVIDDESRPISRHCRQRMPPPILSSETQLQAIFTTFPGLNDEEIGGFEANYEFVTDFAVEVTGTQSGDCDFSLKRSEATNGTFTSPNFPGLYPRNIQCIYHFDAESGEKTTLKITFEHLDVEGIEPKCTDESDFIEFRLGHHMGPRLPLLCGVKHGRKPPPSFTFTFQYFLDIVFHSNDVYEATGFKATYEYIP